LATPGDKPPAHEDVEVEFGTDRTWWRRAVVRSTLVGVGVCALLFASLVLGGVIGGRGATTTSQVHLWPGQTAPQRLTWPVTSIDLPAARTKPALTPTSIALTRTAPHEVFGYVPYWSLSASSSLPVGDFTTIDYFGVEVSPVGTIEEYGPGWDGYQSQDLVDLISRAHAANARVVLTVSDFSQQSLDVLTQAPDAGVTLANELSVLLESKNLDGVNLDLEGAGNGDQAGLDNLVSKVDFELHLANPSYQLTMTTYASSAANPNGFYDIKGLARWVDAFYVMAYDVNGGSSENGAPDTHTVGQYTSIVPASKVILGLPLFGYDVPTMGPALGDTQTGVPVPVTYGEATDSGVTYWDAASNTAWTSYQIGSEWHQVFFDNANTFASKRLLAARSNLLGLGVWALGMGNGDGGLLSALAGAWVPSTTPRDGPGAGGVSPESVSLHVPSGSGTNGGYLAAIKMLGGPKGNR
jgi:hypothetical protein